MPRPRRTLASLWTLLDIRPPESLLLVSPSTSLKSPGESTTSLGDAERAGIADPLSARWPDLTSARCVTEPSIDWSIKLGMCAPTLARSLTPALILGQSPVSHRVSLLVADLSAALVNRCDKRFSRSDELTRHVRIHASDRGRKKAAAQAAAAAAAAGNGGGANSPQTAAGRKAKAQNSRGPSPIDEVSL